MIIILSSAFLTIDVSAEPVIGSTLITLYPVADSYVDSANPNSNYGDSTRLLTKLNSQYAYIMFDLSGIPSDANIISATLKVSLSDIGGYTGSIGAHHCPDVSWTELGITWNNKPDFAETATDTVYFGLIVFHGYKSWNVTADVKAALSKGKLTEVLVDYRSSSYASFDSRERADSPRLEVEYSVEPIYDIHFESIQDTGASSNVGQITFAEETFSLPVNMPVVSGSYEVTYNGGYVFLRWETSGGVNVSDAYARTTTVTILGTGTLRAVGSGETIEYAYDDGTAEYSVDKVSSQIIAVRFTPVLSDRLTGARIYFRGVSYDVSQNVVKVHVLDSSRRDLIEPFTQTPTSKGWLDVDLSAYGLTVMAGTDFYIAVEWTTDYYPMIGKDSDQPDKRSWFWDGSTWSLEEDYDYMIRAVVGKAPSTITCSSSPDSVTIDSSVTVSGSISPIRSGAEVKLTYSKPDGTTFTRIVTTTTTGTYSDICAPDILGLWSVYASWAGDEVYAGATSPKSFFNVTKASSEISCSLSTHTVAVGKGITISGSTTPPRPGITAYLLYSNDGGKTWNSITSVTTSPAGSYSYIWAPPSVGPYIIKSYWNGDDEYNGASSPLQSLTVERATSTITCSASPASIIIGSSTEIGGTTSPPVAGVTVTIYYKVGGEAWNMVSTVTTTSTGSYTYTWNPALIGTYKVKANWAGDEVHYGAESDPITVTVMKKATEISCTLSKATVKKGESLTVSGSINPSREGVTVTLIYTAPDGTALTRTVLTTEAGAYSDAYMPEKGGSWTVKASWAGDEEYSGAESPPASFIVEEKGGPCLIATATYGSELTPEVQFLRSFRDQEILSTFAGSQFMSVFNTWYYSFSPYIANFIVDKPVIRGFLKAALYPLIGILHLSSATYVIFGFNEELGVVMAGLVASSLIGIVYFSPLMIISLIAIKRHKKSLPNLEKLKPLLVPLVVSLGLVYIGEITAVSVIMMAATGALVVLTVMLSAIIIALKVVQQLS
jgi:hypothetical protein